MTYPERFAVIDLGSNSVRMNLYGISPEGYYMLLDQAKEKVRLSEGMGDKQLIRTEPLKRLNVTLRQFRQLLRVYRIDNVSAVATAALRQASNQQEVLQQIESESGFFFEVIPGDREAELDYLGVINSMCLKRALLIDMGGASTELILVEDRKMKHRISLPYGSVNLSERFGDQKLAADFLTRVLDSIPWLDEARGAEFIGLGGTIRTLAKISRSNDSWPIFTIHNYSMKADRLDDILRLIEQTREENLQDIEGISESRYDILKPALAMIRLLYDRLRPKGLRISINGLRDGIFFERYLCRRYGQPIVENVLEEAIGNLERRYDLNSEHSAYVQRLSLELFDAAADLSFQEADRRLLALAARLHDIGMVIDNYSHQNHGFYLTLHSGMYGLSDQELIRLAMLVGLHRQKPLLFDLSVYRRVIGGLTFDRTYSLANFLAIAEQLDRSESQKVISIKRHGSAVHIKMRQGEDPSLEQRAAAKSLRLFEKKYGLSFHFV